MKKKLILQMGTYDGEVNKMDKPHGKGVYIFSAKARYEGMFKNGHIHGKGTFFYDNGDKHIGYFKDNFANGKGSRFLKNGKILTGIWKDGELIKWKNFRR